MLQTRASWRCFSQGWVEDILDEIEQKILLPKPRQNYFGLNQVKDTLAEVEMKLLLPRLSWWYSDWGWAKGTVMRLRWNYSSWSQVEDTLGKVKVKLRSHYVLNWVDNIFLYFYTNSSLCLKTLHWYPSYVTPTFL